MRDFAAYLPPSTRISPVLILQPASLSLTLPHLAFLSSGAGASAAVKLTLPVGIDSRGQLVIASVQSLQGEDDLRHIWASWLIQTGVPISVLQEIDGWESIDMVRRYAHLAPGHMTEHAKQIDAIFGRIIPNLSHMALRDGTDSI